MPNPQEILQSHLFLMSRNFDMQGCQWYLVKRIKSTIAVQEIVRKVCSISLLSQAIFISSMKPISSSIFSKGFD